MKKNMKEIFLYEVLDYEKFSTFTASLDWTLQ